MTPIELLDQAFSLFVRLRDSDNEGFVQCCTCKTIGYYKKLQCGHFESRRHLATRWDEKNTGPQCVSCNIFNQGRQEKFGHYLNKKYGPGTTDLILIKTRSISKIGKFEMGLLTIHFKQLYEELKKGKRLSK